MSRTSRLCALLVGTAFALGLQPAAAQNASGYTPPQLLTNGTTSRAIAGSGTVVVQVQVNADGTHKALKISKSTNAGDNAAAMEIAQSSSFIPAHRGTTAVTAFYDYTLTFSGSKVSQAPLPAKSSPPASGKKLTVTARIWHFGEYTAADVCFVPAADLNDIRRVIGGDLKPGQTSLGTKLAGSVAAVTLKDNMQCTYITTKDSAYDERLDTIALDLTVDAASPWIVFLLEGNANLANYYEVDNPKHTTGGAEYGLSDIDVMPPHKGP